MPPVLIALLIALGVSALGFVVAPWKTLIALGIGISVLLAAVVAIGRHLIRTDQENR